MATFAAITSRAALSQADLDQFADIVRRHSTYVPSETKSYLHRSARSALVELCEFASKSAATSNGEGLSMFDGRAWTSGLARFLTIDDMANGRVSPDEIHGSFVWVRINANGEIVVEYDPLLSVPVFYASNGKIAVVSDRLRICAEVVGAGITDPLQATWVSSIGYVAGETTQVTEVRRAPAAGSLRLSGGEMFVGSPRSLRDHDATIDELFDLYRSSVKDAFTAHLSDRRGIRLGLSGGKDSRAVLALLMSADLHKTASFFVYDFAHELGGGAHAVVAKAIAGRFGLSLEVMPRTSALAAAPSFDRLIAILRTHALATQGRTCGFDRVGIAPPSTEVTIGGGFGELLKHNFKGAVPALDRYSIDTTILTLDPFGALRPGGKEVLAEDVRRVLVQQAVPTSDSRDYADLFYILNRVPNWLGTINAVQRVGQGSFSPLYNRHLLPLALRLSYRDRSEHAIHYRLTSEVSQDLAAMAFANDRWAARLGPSEPPVKDPEGIPRHGGWQHTLLTSPELLQNIGSFIAETDGSWQSMINKDVVLETIRAGGISLRHVSALLGMMVSNMNESESLTGPKAAYPKASADEGDWLLFELDRARVVPDRSLPMNVVRMGSTVRFRSERGGERVVTLVYPGEADISAGRVSVLTPVGTALIGLREGQSIAYLARDGRRQALTVLSVVGEPSDDDPGPLAA